MRTKNIFTAILAFLLYLNLNGQERGLSYKAIISESGNLLKNKNVNVKFIILEGGLTNVYEETHSTITNENGIVALTIGLGDSLDDFNEIDWSKEQFLKVEVDKGNGYIHLGTSQFREVPYAIHANTANHLVNPIWDKYDSIINTENNVSIGIKEPNDNAKLEIYSDNKGLLIPRLKIKDLNQPKPLSNHVAGMLAYNTFKGLEGLYYNNGLAWVKSNESENFNAKSICSSTSIIVVESIEDMKNTDVTDNCTTIFEVLGYDTPNDGGGGTFFYDPNSDVDNNGGTIFESNIEEDGRLIRLYSGALNVRWFGAKSDVTDDQSTIFKSVIATAKITEDAVFIPNGKYAINSTLFIHEGLNLYGENMKNTKLTGTAGSYAIIKNVSDNTSNGGRIQLSSFSIDTASDMGIETVSLSNVYPFTASYRNIEVKAKETAISVEGLSHGEFQSIFCKSEGTAFKMFSTEKNTGVITFTNCQFGDALTNEIGFHFAEGSALDSYTFNSCFFSGKQYSELIGNGDNNVVGITHIACHYERNTDGGPANAAAVKFEGSDNGSLYIGGAISCSWIDCHISAVGDNVSSAVSFDKGNYQSISFQNTSFIPGSNYAFDFDDEAVFRDCKISGLRGSVNQNNIFDDESKDRLWVELIDWTGGWEIEADNIRVMRNNFDPNGIKFSAIEGAYLWDQYKEGDVFINKQVGYDYSGPNYDKPFAGYICVTDTDSNDNGNKIDKNFKPFGRIIAGFSSGPPTDNKTYKRGEIVYNTNPSPGSYVGWICTQEGTPGPGTWKGFGLIEN